MLELQQCLRTQGQNIFKLVYLMNVLLGKEVPPPFLSPLAYKLPLDWMFIAQCTEQNREVIKPRTACWYLMTVSPRA